MAKVSPLHWTALLQVYSFGTLLSLLKPRMPNTRIQTLIYGTL